MPVIMTLQGYFQDLWTFKGPLLSVLQAFIGTCFALYMTKYLANRFDISKQRTINHLLVFIWAFFSSVILVLLGKAGLHLNLPPYMYYPIPVAIALLIPKFLFNLSWKEEGIYVLIGTVTGLATHLLFSLFAGYNNYLPFWKIDAVWAMQLTTGTAAELTQMTYL